MRRDSAFLLVSFGGPEGPDDVMPFLRNVTAGRGVPDERLAKVAEHYYLFGGVSPINGQCRDLLDAIGKDFAAKGIELPLYWGNRNWAPYLADTMQSMADDGITRVIALATSAYSSFSSCRQYLDDLDRARASGGERAPAVVKIPPYYRHPAFTSSFARAAERALAALPDGLGAEADLVFTAHSIPASMAAASGPDGGAYPAQLAEAARLVAAAVGKTNWKLAYQSRSGPPTVPWLEPDVNDCLTDLARDGSQAICIIPIGFVSDHLEVRYDLDIEAARTARELGVPLVRAATPGADSRFVAMISDLVRDYADERAAPVLAALGPDAAGFCGRGCCGSDEDRAAGWLSGRRG